MNTVTDWKGNEIKPGMEVCFIKVIDRQIFRCGYIEPVVPGFAHIAHCEDEKPDVPCWEVGEYHEVIGDELIITVKSGRTTLYNPLSFVIHFAMNMETHILAIKGISDKPDNICT